ncbi:hypothetical protein [Phycicoccus duodecadis]|uniref:Uncharacterized protein n=1 Tax=Phycicoccus duodecadis TaxID=173053 RepID=A0A2N3YJU2_9MICO|nr:hypothetical protein [Phycicoccus duodecadis]PKW27127.1 hypothetical protein ATL31_1963 [Phycicoccus duodecadis]
MSRALAMGAATAVACLAALTACTGSPSGPSSGAPSASGAGSSSTSPSGGGSPSPTGSRPPSATTAPSSSSSTDPRATPVPTAPPGSSKVVIDVLAQLRDAGSTSGDGGIGAARTSVGRATRGGVTGWFADAIVSVKPAASGEAYASAQSATPTTLRVPVAGTYEYDWHVTYSVAVVAPSGGGDGESIHATSTVDPGLFSDYGQETTVDLTVGAGGSTSSANGFGRRGRFVAKAGDPVQVSLAATCTVDASGAPRNTSCRSWVGFDRFTIRLVAP